MCKQKVYILKREGQDTKPWNFHLPLERGEGHTNDSIYLGYDSLIEDLYFEADMKWTHV